MSRHSFTQNCARFLYESKPCDTNLTCSMLFYVWLLSCLGNGKEFNEKSKTKTIDASKNELSVYWRIHITLSIHSILVYINRSAIVLYKYLWIINYNTQSFDSKNKNNRIQLLFSSLKVNAVHVHMTIIDLVFRFFMQTSFSSIQFPRNYFFSFHSIWIKNEILFQIEIIQKTTDSMVSHILELKKKRIKVKSNFIMIHGIKLWNLLER